MPWKESSVMSERMKFLTRLLDGERMADLCREFGISRKTGYKILGRYHHEGASAFENRSSRPNRCPHKTPEHITSLIVKTRNIHPTWGAPKIRTYLCRKYSEEQIPAASTIHSILDRSNLIQRRVRRNKFKAKGTELIAPNAPNELWCADFKGHFKMKNGYYCYPLTISDQWSRFVLCVDAHEGTDEESAFGSFINTFQKFGIPKSIRTDNGVPFSTRTIGGLSKLSVWWLRLGINIERIRPGHPQENGSHERMHRTLKQTALGVPGKNILQQQESFDSFQKIYNHERPHDGIGGKRPEDLYLPSTNKMPTFLKDPDYPTSDFMTITSQDGYFCHPKKRRVYLSQALGGQRIGIKQVDEGVWSIHFLKYELGFYDDKSWKFCPKENPLETEEDLD